MKSSKYTAQIRREMKFEQRSPEYRELQRRTAEERSKLEAVLRDRNAVIARLKSKLIEIGYSAADIDRLAA